MSELKKLARLSYKKKKANTFDKSSGMQMLVPIETYSDDKRYVCYQHLLTNEYVYYDLYSPGWVQFDEEDTPFIVCVTLEGIARKDIFSFNESKFREEIKNE